MPRTVQESRCPRWVESRPLSYFPTSGMQETQPCTAGEKGQLAGDGQAKQTAMQTAALQQKKTNKPQHS